MVVAVIVGFPVTYLEVDTRRANGIKANLMTGALALEILGIVTLAIAAMATLLGQ